MMLKKIVTLFALVLLFQGVSNIYGQSIIYVTSANDPVNPASTVSGELRYAINQANLNSGTTIIYFQIPYSGSPISIFLKTSLPTITKSVWLDAATYQNGYLPDDPAIVIAGDSLSWTSALDFNGANNSKVKGIRIKSFYIGILLYDSDSCEILNNSINEMSNEYAKCIELNSSNYCTIKGNYINTDKNHSVFFERAEEGIIFSGNSSHNIIGGIGCGEGNTIAYTRSEGIDNFPNPGTSNNNFYSGNLIFENVFSGGSVQYAILLRGAANNNKAAPVISTTGCTTSGTSGAGDIIQLFGSTGPSDSIQNANKYITTVTANGSGNWSATLYDIQYPYITATATDSLNNTSQLAPAKSISVDTLVLSFSSPDSLCMDETYNFTNTSTACSDTITVMWDFGDGSAVSSNSGHAYSSPGIYTIRMFTSDSAFCPQLSITKNITIYDCSCCQDPYLYINSDSLNTHSIIHFSFNSAIALCKDVTYNLTSGCSNIVEENEGGSHYWKLLGGELNLSSTDSLFSFSVGDTGTYVLTLKRFGDCDSTIEYMDIIVIDCLPPPCFNCIGSFAPIPSKKYVVSAWVKEDGAAATKTSYTYPQIIIECPSISFSTSAFSPGGEIIDGWQKIEGEFTIPDTATDLRVKLNCTTGDCYFDDIRVFPYDGSMKSYVYDPVNMRLVAELDERNYATKYEYDEEGKLVRVKKETERGFMTIKENRNNTQK